MVDFIGTHEDLTVASIEQGTMSAERWLALVRLSRSIGGSTVVAADLASVRQAQPFVLEPNPPEYLERGDRPVLNRSDFRAVANDHGGRKGTGTRAYNGLVDIFERQITGHFVPSDLPRLVFYSRPSMTDQIPLRPADNLRIADLDRDNFHTFMQIVSDLAATDESKLYANIGKHLGPSVVFMWQQVAAAFPASE